MNIGKNMLLAGGGMAAALLLSGCVVTAVTHDDRPRYYEEPRRTVVVAQPQPVYVQPQPVYVQPPAEVIVREPMPVVRVERPGPPPEAGVVWINGYYVPGPGGRGWEWRSGHYERPPRPNAVWVEPRHEVRNDGVHVTLGFWR